MLCSIAICYLLFYVLNLCSSPGLRNMKNFLDFKKDCIYRLRFLSEYSFVTLLSIILIDCLDQKGLQLEQGGRGHEKRKMFSRIIGKDAMVEKKRDV